MGCTSSAPNMANITTAEKSIQFDDDTSDSNSKDVDEIIYRAADDKKELPSCDNITELVHLVRNKSTSSFIPEKESPENKFVNNNESNTETKASDTQIHEEKVSRLEDIVEKVVELHAMTERAEDIQALETVTEEQTNIEENVVRHNVDDNNAVTKIDHDPAAGQDEEKDDHHEETLSPSQSESSRATRWEALADIAAELPPSLTVDPITGQIYALHK